MNREGYREVWKTLKLRQESLRKELRQVDSELEAMANEMGVHGVEIGWKRGEPREVDVSKIAPSYAKLLGLSTDP